MTISTFDRRVLDAYLTTRRRLHTGHAQAICVCLDLPLTADNLARVLRAIHRLTRAARALHDEQTRP